MKSSLYPLHIIQQLLLLFYYAAVRSHNIVAIKEPQNADGSAASKVEPMMDSDAMLTLVGQIIHVDHEYSEILHTKQHDVGPVQCRFTRHIVQYVHSLHSTKSNHPLKLFHFGINVEWI